MKKIIDFEEYKKIEPFLNFKLGINDTETKILLTENEGPEFLISNTGLISAYWSDNTPALNCCSAGGYVSRERSAIIKSRIE